jgi:hypothetical protein
MNVQTRPLSQRRIDIFILIFFVINLSFITYIVDLEQLVIPDPSNFTYPVWPPAFLVDVVHNYGNTIDPLLIARPPWWKMTIWIDVLFFGPFYAFAIYAFIKGREWIRIPTFVYSGMMLSNVIIILGEEITGLHASPQLPLVLLLNAPWLLMPLFLIYRMARSPHPFTESLPAANVAKNAQWDTAPSVQP